MHASLVAAVSTILALGLAGTAEAVELPKRYAIVVAVDTYQSRDVPQLQYAERDARTVAERLQAQGYYVTRLIGKERARRSEIIEELLLAQEQVRPGDSFVLFFAGHGVRKQSNGQVYWLNYDGDPHRPDIDGLRMGHLIELVREIPTTNRLVLLDHCYAGDVQMPMSGIGEGRDATMTRTPLMTAREAIPVDFDRSLLGGGGGGPERSLFVVAASRGVAFEDPQLMHGRFTDVLLAALREPNADTEVDGGVNVRELMTFVEVEVVKRSSSRQVPMTRSEERQPLAARWQPFIRTLSAAEVADRRQQYTEKLRVWTNRQLMTAEIQTLGEQVLDRWQTAPTALSPRDEVIVSTLRLLLDQQTGIDDEIVAAEVSRIVQFELGH